VPSKRARPPRPTRARGGVRAGSCRSRAWPSPFPPRSFVTRLLSKYYLHLLGREIRHERFGTEFALRGLQLHRSTTRSFRRSTPLREVREIAFGQRREGQRAIGERRRLLLLLLRLLLLGRGLLRGRFALTLRSAPRWGSGSRLRSSSSCPCACLLWPHHRGETHQGSTGPRREEARRDSDCFSCAWHT